MDKKIKNKKTWQTHNTSSHVITAKHRRMYLPSQEISGVALLVHVDHTQLVS